jgi:hypothetical protein
VGKRGWSQGQVGREGARHRLAAPAQRAKRQVVEQRLHTGRIAGFQDDLGLGLVGQRGAWRDHPLEQQGAIRRHPQESALHDRQVEHHPVGDHRAGSHGLPR